MTWDEWINAFIVEMQMLRRDEAYALRFFRAIATQLHAAAPESDPREAARQYHERSRGKAKQ